MIELEVLFNNGQGVIVPLEDRETALRFMKQAMDAKLDAAIGLFHLSTSFDEMLFDLRDICFIRLKKENVPLIGATLKLPAVSATRLQAEAAAQDGLEAEHGHADPDSASSSQSAQNADADSDEKNEQAKNAQAKKPDPLQAEYDVLKSQIQKAEQQFQKAEERLGKIEQQRLRVEAELRQQREAMEETAREAKLKSSIEAIEIDNEISRMKEKKQP